NSTYVGAMALQTFSGGLALTAANLSSTGAGSLLLGGDVASNAAGTASTIAGTLDLGGTARTFIVANGAAANDLRVSAVLTNGSVVKTGAGQLRLTGANTYAGPTTVSGGNLLVD